MEELLTPSNITFAIGIIAIIFSVYNYFKSPQEDLEKKQAVYDERIKGKATIREQQEIDNKATLLAQQVEWEKCANEKKFIDFGIRLDEAFKLAQNHIHTVDVKCDKLIESVNLLSGQIVKLSTILEERVPRK